jgi:NarL family two-component system response regulator LiaR
VPDKTTPARLIIADDHDLVRDGMRAMLAKEPDLEVVGQAKDGREALELCRSLSPDLVLMDVRMPRMDGLEATQEIKAECPKTTVLIVTTHENPDYLLDAIKAGAAGYVLKESTRAQLTSAIRSVLGGESPLHQDLAMRLLRRLASEDRAHRQAPSATKRQEPPPGFLTARELDVLRSLVSGKTNCQIASELHLSTVKGHLERLINSLINKLGVSDRTQAAVKAVELGLLPEQREV